MEELINVLSGLIDKPFYYDWSFWLSLLNLILISITFYEIQLTRKVAQRQNKDSIRPVLSFSSKNGNYVIINPSGNIAFNVYILLKNGHDYRIMKSGLIIGALPSQTDKLIEEKELVAINETDLARQIPSIVNLHKYLECKKENYSCLIYQDSAGHKLYSVFFVSSKTLPYDQFFESGYLDDLGV
jgi:hypothetical protein